jgi:hypothetical protein
MLKIISPNYIKKAAAISKIDTEKKPVIFWDTCSLLDIVRLPLPCRKQKAVTLNNLLIIKDNIVSGNIISLSSILCINEFNNHIEQHVNELKKESLCLSEKVNTFVSFINVVNTTGMPIPRTNLSEYKIENFLSQIAHDIIDNTFFVNEDNSFASFAHNRTTLKVPPAKKKGEYKDCYIWGTCLELRSNSTDRTYSYNFISSNTTDYADKNNRNFVTEIKNEADLNEIEYFSNFNVALGRLKTKGII